MKEVRISFTNDKVVVKDKAGVYLQSVLTEEVSIWLSELNNARFYFKCHNGFDFDFEFEEDQDAIMFKLIWG